MNNIQILIAEMSIGTMVQIAGFAVVLLSVAVTVGYFKGKFEGVERDVNEMKAEKKKELTEQSHRNNDYHTRLVNLESGMKNILDHLRELKADVKNLGQTIISGRP